MNLNLKRPTICYLICFFLLISSSLQKNLNHKRDVSYEIDEQQPQTEYKYYVQEEENNQLPRDLQQKYASDDVMSFTVQPKSSATNNNNQLENVTVKVGQQAVMPCFVNNLGSFKVIWAKNGDILSLGSTKINSDPRLNIQHRYVSEWHLIIDNVVTDDEGEYICKTNGNFFKIINLQVQMPPQIDDLQSTPAGTITLKEESSITLRCLADGKPEPTVKWYRWKKYKHLMSEKEELINQIGNEITITSIKRNDPNVYECIAKNSVPPATSRIFTIEIHYLPDVDVEIRKAFQFLHKKFSIECKITSNPLEKLFWLKNGHQLLMNNNEDNKNVFVEKYDVSNINELHKTLLTLTVQNAQKDDFGEYECCAMNAYGQICSNVIVQEIKSDRKHHVQTTIPTTTTFSAAPPSTISIKNNDFILLNTKQENLIIDDLTDSELNNDTSISSSLSDNSLDSKDKRRHYLIKTKYLESQSANTAATSLTADSSLSSSSELIAKSNLFLYLLFIIILSLFIPL